MNTDNKQQQLEAQAATWFTTMHSGEQSKDVRDAFETWLHSDRAHKIAYCAFEQVYRDLDFVAVEAGIDVNAALGRASRKWPTLIASWLKRPPLIGGALLAGTVMVALTLSILISAQPVAIQETPKLIAASELTTQLAEIRVLTLEDGSLVTLGARSRIETIFTKSIRQVTLLEGEAFFEVTKDPSRPFFVAAQDTLVRVVGTKFDVKRSADIVHVSVLEGIVEVMKPNDIPKVLATADTSKIAKQVLSAGERVSSARRVALPQVRQIEQVEPGAWRQGRLAYEDASLAEIVADLNRYYDQPISIASSDIGDLRSTLAFQTSEINQVFDVMEAIHPLQVERSSSGVIIMRRKR